MWVVAQEAFRGMDAEAERHMDVLERPPELQPTHRSAFLRLFPSVPHYGAYALFSITIMSYSGAKTTKS